MAKYFENVDNKAWIIEVKFTEKDKDGNPLYTQNSDQKNEEAVYIKQHNGWKDNLTVRPKKYFPESLRIAKELNKKIHFENRAFFQLENLLWHEPRVEEAYYTKIKIYKKQWYALRLYEFRSTEIYVNINAQYADLGVDEAYAPLNISLFNDDILFISPEEFLERKLDSDAESKIIITEKKNNEHKTVDEFLKDIKPVNLKTNYSNIEEAGKFLINIYETSSLLKASGEISNKMEDFKKDAQFYKCYDIGRDIYSEGVRLSEQEYFDLAALFLSIAASGKYNSYEAMGDCLMRKREYDKALKLYKTKIYYEDKRFEEINKETTAPASSNKESPDYSESFFKIAICLNKLGYNSDLIKGFLSESKEQLSDYYESMNDWGYKDWDDVYSKLILK